MKKLRIILGLAINLGSAAFYIWLLAFTWMQSPAIGMAVTFGLYGLNLISLIHIMFINKRSDNLIKGAWLSILVVPGWGFQIHTTFGLIGFWRRGQLRKMNEFEDRIFTKFDYANTKIEPLQNGEEKFPVLLKELEKAQKTIHINYFIISGGIVWEKVKKTLIKKANEGVEIIVGTDWVGNIASSDKNYAELKENGIQFKHFNNSFPPFSTGRANQRNHNKIVIIDNKVAFFGGINIGDEYAHMYQKYGYWNDMQYKVTGELVQAIQERFIVDWYQTTMEEHELPAPNYDKVVTDTKIKLLLDNPNKEEKVWMDRILYRIDNAKTRIRFATPYLIPPFKIEKALIDARERGVEVEIIMPGRADKASAYSGSKMYADKLTAAGINVYVTDNTFLHTKLFLFDDEVSIIGSSNLDYRAIFHHYEMNFDIDSKTLSADLNNRFIHIMERSNLNTTKSSEWGLIRSLWWTTYKLMTTVM